MYVQEIHSKKNGTTYTTILIRESFRTAQGPRTRTVCNISDLSESVRRVIAESLKGNRMVNALELELESALDYGGLAVLKSAWDRFGLERVLSSVPDKRDRGLLKAMIFSRLLFPSSKLALREQAQGTLLASACGLDGEQEQFDEDDLYDAMDRLNGRWVGIEKALYREGFNQGVQVVLYDLTSVYFEGSGPTRLAKYGHSRDHRGDRPQVVVAVATDREGMPIHVEVLRGNRNDTTTLHGLLTTLRRRFGIKEAIFVFDGGMSSKLNLEALQADELNFVTRVSASTFTSLLKQLPEDHQPELWDRTQILDVTHEGKRYVIAGGVWRKQRDSERRQSRLQKAEVALLRLAAVKRKRVNAQKLASQVGRTLLRLKAHHYFIYHVNETGQLEWKRKEAVLTQEEKIDGWYILHTNLPKETADGTKILSHYKNLLDVEEAFCQLKSYLEVRPIFHFRPDRVRNHIRICFLAYWLSARLGREWRALGENGEVPRLLRQMQSIRIGSLLLNNCPFTKKLTKIPPDLNVLLKKLDLLPLFSYPPTW